MAYQWKLPDVGEGIHEAEIVRWHVKPGDVVALDQPIAEIQTDKAVVEIPSPVKGTVRRLLANEGDVVRVGTVVVEFDAPDSSPEAAPGAPSGGSSHTPEKKAPTPSGIAVKPPGQRALATPAVRRLARELGVDIQTVRGSGEGGRVLAEDVRKAQAQAGKPPIPRPEPAPPSDHVLEERIPLRGTRRAIAEHMVKSKFTAPHVTTMDEVEVSRLVALRDTLKEDAARRGIKLTYLPFVLKALVHTLKQFPYLNASLDDTRGEIVLKRVYHMGIAVDDPEGLVVPVVRDADRKSLLDIAAEVARLVEKAHAHTLTPAELSGSTFTLTNFGSFGGLFATPIINYPEVAVFGTGRIQKKAVVLEDETIAVRPMMSVSLTFDHRVIDGGMAGRFLNRVMEYLSNPNLLFMEMI